MTSRTDRHPKRIGQRPAGLVVRRALIGSVALGVLAAASSAGAASLPGRPGAHASARTSAVTVVGRPVAVRAGHQESMAFGVPNNSYCVVIEQLGSSRVLTSPTNLFAPVAAYSWRVPLQAKPGPWTMTMSCGATTASASLGTLGKASVRVQVLGGRPTGTAFPMPSGTAPWQVLAHGEGSGYLGRGGVGAYRPCGAVLVAGTQWFGGRGVDVRSNGPWNAAPGEGGLNCAGKHQVGSLEFQSVDLVERFVTKALGLPLLYWNQSTGADLYQAASHDPEDWTVHRAGSGYQPVAGDLMAWSGRIWGHAAVVATNANGKLTWAEQNASPFGEFTASLLPNDMIDRAEQANDLGSGFAFLGYMHAKANVSPPRVAPVAVAVAGDGIAGETQSLMLDRSGTVFHNIRHANGTWQGWVRLGFTGAVSIAAAGDGNAGEAELVVANRNGTVLQNLRRSNGTWQGWLPLGITDVVSVAAASDRTAGETQYLVAKRDGTLDYNIHLANGTWLGWVSLGSLNAVAVAVAGDDKFGESQFLVVTRDGGLEQNVRHSDGTLQGWISAGMSGVVAIAAAGDGVPGETQFLAANGDGAVFHNVAYTQKAWRGWLPAGLTYAGSVAAAGDATAGEAQFLAASKSGSVFQDLRQADGTWLGWATVP